MSLREWDQHLERLPKFLDRDLASEVIRGLIWNRSVAFSLWNDSTASGGGQLCHLRPGKPFHTALGSESNLRFAY